MTFKPSKYQKEIFRWVRDKKGKNLVVEALAGSGKTTTAVKLLQLIPKNEEVVFCAFNKHIASELQKRVPYNVRASTYHSLGLSICGESFGDIEVKHNKVDILLYHHLDKYRFKFLYYPISRIVSLLKSNLLEPTPENIDDLAIFHNVELYDKETIVYDAVKFIMEESKNKTYIVDYDDMCWLPVVLDLPSYQYDFMVIDELQDTNKVQIELAMKSVKQNGRVVGVGDSWQSVYAFRGADADAVPRLINRLDADTLPLSITYRNPKLIVNRVREKFPHIPLEAAEDAKQGEISIINKEQAFEKFQPGDMILCRTNAPLVDYAFELIRNGIKANIRGRDIGKNLQSLVKKMRSDDIYTTLDRLSDYRNKEVAKLIASEKYSSAQAIEDKIDTIIAVSSGVNSVQELLQRIDSIFSDEKEEILLSSVHRAKGLEARNIYILRPDLMPHSSAKHDWERQQEANIEYVAITRSLDKLYYVLEH